MDTYFVDYDLKKKGEHDYAKLCEALQSLGAVRLLEFARRWSAINGSIGSGWCVGTVSALADWRTNENEPAAAASEARNFLRNMIETP